MVSISRSRNATSRITLRLSADLHRRLRAVSRRTGVSLNQLIVTALNEAIVRNEEGGQEHNRLVEELRHIRMALGDLAVEIDPGQLPAALRSMAELAAQRDVSPPLPTLAPPLSATVIEGREDRA